MFQHLPVELLHYIFMLLSPCTDFPNLLGVCKRWRDACIEVMRMRDDVCSSAYRLEAPLRWTIPKALPYKASTQSAPSKRFGSMILHHDQSIYVFGGATSMFTTFNDLWIYDMVNCNWRRVLGAGELPTPRAQAKGGFIGEILYLFGGCQSLHHPGWHQSGRIDWLSDLSSFDTVKLFWSRVQLRHIDHTTVQNPHVNAGQSGCFLPAGPDGEPAVFLLFGGISPVSGACVEDLCIISPDLGRWFTVKPITYGVGWPAGRCGHSVCALDSNRALVMFGNLESFMAPSFDIAAPKPYRGRPAGDMWILTRCKSSESAQDWFSSQWFWTEIQCPINVPGCPPIDFYHEAIISLPYVDADKTESAMENCYDTPIDIVYTVLCVSQSTDQLLEEAIKQRRNWQRRKPVILSRNISSPLPSTSALSNSLERTGALLSQGGSDSEEHGEMVVETSVPSASSASKSSIISNTHSSDILPSIYRPSATFKSGCRRTAEKRIKRLEALAVQERRLFGSRTNSSVASEASMHLDSHNVTGNLTKPLKTERIISSHPMAVYSLRIRISPKQNPQSSGQWSPATGQWLTASKPNYMDLLFGPPKCLGFSCTFAYGCVFLFGGDTEELPNDVDNAVPAALNLPEDPVQHADAFRPLNNSRDPVDRAGPGHLRPLTFVAKPIASQYSHFFVLQPRSLAGTLV
ncbi:hypothetical protein EG68_09862 [Paragonimus skrjabini miyazakii]|uniref:F-box domain-containing protein n=1 Tax=Paragonimus skrjabini miyazakii TaxID=59628 RepID=A0A8S9Y9D7_9TREM|nr:hypothetical protein EG68_09862 [Paragonimus skrjabini miyazakii]